MLCMEKESQPATAAAAECVDDGARMCETVNWKRGYESGETHYIKRWCIKTFINCLSYPYSAISFAPPLPSPCAHSIFVGFSHRRPLVSSKKKENDEKQISDERWNRTGVRDSPIYTQAHMGTHRPLARIERIESLINYCHWPVMSGGVIKTTQSSKRHTYTHWRFNVRVRFWSKSPKTTHLCTRWPCWILRFKSVVHRRRWCRIDQRIKQKFVNDSSSSTITWNRRKNFNWNCHFSAEFIVHGWRWRVCVHFFAFYCSAA